ncbi:MULTISPECIES: IS66 family insertion sequence element accessory protein TnpB [unclassified Sporosarcina]|uniref:IS66 family insertion sequence element accessory protein TnpB n=1 Tax=unclassified Sporosarcina TaxID=2647733 RepID=UPI00203B2A84|nr:MULTISPECIES: IS66 family insertion sequence element accessory protein TnpB [unclassified Sporosarcina]GKV67486.1 transposase [Sporosarcina sp. NCCP-2331]GLB57850.1 transposase [Sporosarcina sp. NCCP-2378]
MRINLDGIKGIYLAHGATDMRLSIDGLSAKVQETFQMDPCTSNLFIFCNRDRDRVKILHWDYNGFWLYYRRLETGRFHWPDGHGEEATSVSPRQLRWMLDGLTIEDGKAFPRVMGTKVV